MAVGEHPNFRVSVLTTDDTPSNREMIPYLPGTVFAGFASRKALWFKQLECLFGHFAWLTVIVHWLP